MVSEQLTRNIQFFGLEKQQRIADAFVVVVGLGVCRCIKLHAQISRIVRHDTKAMSLLFHIMVPRSRRAWAAMQPICC